MNPEDLARILDDLGKRLGPTGEYVFGLAVRYKVTDAAVGIAFSAIIIVAAALTVRWVYRHDFRDSYDRGPALAITAGVGGLLSVLAGWMLFANVVTLLNPEYAAIRDILDAIGGSR